MRKHNIGSSKEGKITIENIRKIVKEHGFILLSTQYENGYTELKFRCSNSHEFMKSWDLFYRNASCPVCAKHRKVELTCEHIEERYPFFCKVEEIREHPKTGELQVRCKNHKCVNSKERDGWFTPSKNQLISRAWSVQNDREGVYFYCSNYCKTTCVLYGKTVPQLIREDKITSDFFEAEEYSVYREEVFKRADYKCEYCGEPAIHCHHIKPQKLEPFFSLDPDYGIACCRKCHYKYGHPTGTECSTGNLAQRICL